MAYHFSANQYEAAYKPPVLRNWEVPKQYVEKPNKRVGRTQIISNDKGHLLPGVPKSPNCPWGNFIGTWDLPCKIDRATANDLSGLSRIKPRYHQNVKVKSSAIPSAVIPAVVEEKREEEKAVVAEETVPVEVTTEPVADTVAVEAEPPKEKELPVPEEEKIGAYVPGDFTEDKYKHPSHEILALNNRFKSDEFKGSYSQGYPRYRDDFSKPLPEIKEAKINREHVENFVEKNREMIETQCRVHPVAKKKPPSPIVAAIKNFQLAKKLHKENLEHDPLPDTITNSKYRKLQMQQQPQQEPGLALKDENFATGVGWKGYPGYGPTRCTKLKVYRPKTCQPLNKNQDLKNDGRPSSVTSFDRKWRFIRQRKVTPIELAICWDMTPENPGDEPKRTPHIDGSNGSLGPAVFSLVHTPKNEEIASEEQSHSGSVFEKAPPQQADARDFVLDRPKTCCPRRKLSRDSSESSKKRVKSAFQLDESEAFEKCSQCSNKTNNSQNFHQSTPNLSECGEKNKKMMQTLPPRKKGMRAVDARRLCMACEMKNVSIKDKHQSNKNEYKMAFKAGVPQKCKDKRQDYPEHWRLATVYQHSYKPIHSRKRPLLATVFK